MSDYTTKNVPEQHYLFVEDNCSLDPEDIGSNMTIAFGSGGGIVGVMPMGAVFFVQSLDGYVYLGIGFILAGVIVLNALSTAASGA